MSGVDWGAIAINLAVVVQLVNWVRAWRRERAQDRMVDELIARDRELDRLEGRESAS